MINATVFIHQLNARLVLKADKYPLRIIALRMLEIGGKVLIIPSVLLTFFWTFTDFGPEGIRDSVTAFCVIVVCYVLARESPGFKADLKKSIISIRGKLENPVEPVTSLEGYVYNMYNFGIFSRSQAHYHRWKREVDKQYEVGVGDEGAATVSADDYSGFGRRDPNASLVVAECGGGRRGSTVDSEDSSEADRDSFVNPIHARGNMSDENAMTNSALPTGVSSFLPTQQNMSDARSSMYEL